MVALAGLILMNAFFVAAEYGLVTSRRTRIMELEHQGNKRARAVLRITANPPRFISAMQLGVTVSSLGIGALGEQVIAHKLDTVLASVLSVIVALLIVTYLHVVVGELVLVPLARRRLVVDHDRDLRQGLPEGVRDRGQGALDQPLEGGMSGQGAESGSPRTAAAFRHRGLS